MSTTPSFKVGVVDMEHDDEIVFMGTEPMLCKKINLFEHEHYPDVQQAKEWAEKNNYHTELYYSQR